MRFIVSLGIIAIVVVSLSDYSGRAFARVLDEALTI